VSGRPRPDQKFEKLHTSILVLSKPSLNPFIVNFLCQFTVFRSYEFTGTKMDFEVHCLAGMFIF
jgi:hypothetical protein